MVYGSVKTVVSVAVILAFTACKQRLDSSTVQEGASDTCQKIQSLLKAQVANDDRITNQIATLAERDVAGLSLTGDPESVKAQRKLFEEYPFFIYDKTARDFSELQQILFQKESPAAVMNAKIHQSLENAFANLMRVDRLKSVGRVFGASDSGCIASPNSTAPTIRFWAAQVDRLPAGFNEIQWQSTQAIDQFFVAQNQTRNVAFGNLVRSRNETAPYFSELLRGLYVRHLLTDQSPSVDDLLDDLAVIRSHPVNPQDPDPLAATFTTILWLDAEILSLMKKPNWAPEQATRWQNEIDRRARLRAVIEKFAQDHPFQILRADSVSTQNLEPLNQINVSEKMKLEIERLKQFNFSEKYRAMDRLFQKEKSLNTIDDGKFDKRSLPKY